MAVKELVIFGAGGMGRGILEIAEAINEVKKCWNISGFLDDTSAGPGADICGYPVLGGKDWLKANKHAYVIVGIGSPAVRHKMVTELTGTGHGNFATLIHPFSSIARRVEIGEGCVVFPGVVIDTETRIGNHVLLNKSATIGHDVVVGDFVNISPAATAVGNCQIADGCDIGSNATLIPGRKIGAWSVVGAGSVVTKHVPGDTTAVGIPAKVIKQREPGWHLK